MLSLALASMVILSDPDVLFLNSSYAIVQDKSGLVCLGCGNDPKPIAGSNKIPYDQQPFVEASTDGMVFLATDVTDSCPIGKQWAVNLTKASIERINTPCGASDLKWSFSESEVSYSYTFNNEKVVKRYQITY